MKKITLLTLFILTSFSLFSQTSIDIVRASNYYSKACNYYSSGSYSSTLENLKLAEDNLKGKTNKDLEYLKIMTNYRLKNFREAYSLVQIYFEEGYNNRSQAFRNVDSFRKIHNIDYEEELTTIFVNLEEKFNLVENVNPDEFIKNLVSRIKKERINFNDYIRKAAQDDYHNSFSYYLRKSTYNAYGRTRNGTAYASLDMVKSQIADNFVVFSGIFSGKEVSSTRFRMKVTYSSTKPYLDQKSYSYGYKYDKTEYITGNISFTKTAYTGQFVDSSELTSSQATSRFVKNLIDDDFTKSGYRKKTYDIRFTENEKIILKQDNNFQKLQTALKQEGLL
jgi:hypothetical protein